MRLRETRNGTAIGEHMLWSNHLAICSNKPKRFDRRRNKLKPVRLDPVQSNAFKPLKTANGKVLKIDSEERFGLIHQLLLKLCQVRAAVSRQ